MVSGCQRTSWSARVVTDASIGRLVESDSGLPRFRIVNILDSPERFDADLDFGFEDVKRLLATKNGRSPNYADSSTADRVEEDCEGRRARAQAGIPVYGEGGIDDGLPESDTGKDP